LVVPLTIASLEEPTPPSPGLPQPGATESGRRAKRESEIRVPIEERTESFMTEYLG